MKTIKENVSGILVCMFELVVGILLLISPINFTSGIIVAAGVGLLVLGLGSVIKYFRTDPVEAAQEQILVKGLVALLVGGFCAFKSEWFVATFPILTLIYGVAILIAGLGKIQWTVDMLRLKKSKWHLSAISAVISIVCSLVIITRPFRSTTVLWVFTGISLIVEAVFDVATLCFDMKEKEKADIIDTEVAADSEEKEPVEAEVAE